MPHLHNSQDLEKAAFLSQELDNGVTKSLETPVPSATKRSVNNRSSKRKRHEKSYSILPYVKRKCLTFDPDEADDTPIFDKNLTEDLAVDKCRQILKNVLVQKYASISQLEHLTVYLNFLTSGRIYEYFDSNTLNNFLQLLVDLLKIGVQFLKQTNELNETEIRQTVQTLERCSHGVTVVLHLFCTPSVPDELNSEEIFAQVFLYLSAQLQNVVASDAQKGKKKGKDQRQLMLTKNLTLLKKLLACRIPTTLNLLDLISKCVLYIVMGQDKSLVKAAISLITKMFELEEDFRAFILNETVFCIRKLPENHKLTSNYDINDDKSINSISSLMIYVTQIVAKFPEAPLSKKEAEKILNNSYENVMSVGGQLVVAHLNQCASNEEYHKHFRLFFEQFIMDLLKVWNCPETPSAFLLIQLVSKPLAEYVLGNKDPMLKAFCVKMLSKIGMSLLTEDIPKKLKSQPLKLIQSQILTYLNRINDPFLSTHFHKFLWWKSGDLKLTDNILQGNVKEISFPEAEAAVYMISIKNQNYPKFDTYLNYVLRASCDSNKKVKATATQCLSDIIRCQPILLSKSTVQKTIYECVNSSSANSREIICSLIGEHVLKCKEEIIKYYNIIFKFLDDPAVSVRRIALCIMQKLVTIHSDFEHKNEICLKILKMVHDVEPSIQKLVVNFFSNLWLTLDSKSHIDTLLILVQRSSQTSWLRQLFEENLKPKTVSITSLTQTQPEEDVQEVCKYLVSELIKISEAEDKISTCMNILLVLANVYPKVLIPFVSDLESILKKNNPNNDYFVPHVVLEILYLVVKQITDHNTDLYKSMYQMLTTYIQREVPSAYPMKYLISIMKFLKVISPIIEAPLIEQWLLPNFDTLNKYLEGSSFKQTQIFHAINITCYLVTLVKSKKLEDVIFKLLQTTKYNICIMHVLCYVLLEDKYIMKNDILQTVIQDYLKLESSSVCKKAALYAMTNYLKNWKEIEAGSLKIQEERNTEVASSFVQKCLNNILHCTQLVDIEVRSMSCHVIEYILNNGIIIEAKLFPYVISFSTDPEASIRMIGTRFLNKIKTNKRWDLVRNSVRGLLVTHNLHVKLSSSNIIRGFEETGGNIKCKNEKLYAIVQQELSIRRHLVDNILHEVVETKTMTREQLYLVDHLATFPYKYLDEVLYLLHQTIPIFSKMSLPEPCPNDETSIAQFVKQFFGYYLLALMKNKLQSVHGISDQKIDKYYSVSHSLEILHKKHISDDYIPKVIFEKFGAINTLLHPMYTELKHIMLLDSSQSERGSQNNSSPIQNTRKKLQKVQGSAISKQVKTPVTSVRSAKNGANSSKTGNKSNTKKTPIKLTETPVASVRNVNTIPDSSRTRNKSSTKMTPIKQCVINEETPVMVQQTPVAPVISIKKKGNNSMTVNKSNTKKTQIKLTAMIETPVASVKNVKTRADSSRIRNKSSTIMTPLKQSVTKEETPVMLEQTPVAPVTSVKKRAESSRSINKSATRMTPIKQRVIIDETPVIIQNNKRGRTSKSMEINNNYN